MIGGFMEFQLPYGVHRKVDIDFTDEVSMTHQSFKAECDINNIIAKYQKNGIVEHVARVQGRYGEFLDSTDYLACMTHVSEAREAFESLPSSLRNRFNNDPATFLDFVHDPNNKDEMIKLGMLNQPILDDSQPDVPSE